MSGPFLVWRPGPKHYVGCSHEIKEDDRELLPDSRQQQTKKDSNYLANKSEHLAAKEMLSDTETSGCYNRHH